MPPTVGAIADQVWDEATSGHVGAGTTGKALTDAGAAGTPPTVVEIADGVWDEVIAGHLTGGTTGAALNGAGSAGDPWTTSLPGAYGAGTAGKIVGDNVNAAITSRMATYTQPTGFLAATFPSDPADQSLVIAATDAVMARLGVPAGASVVADIATRLATAGYTVPPTPAEIADGVWDELIAGHLGAGSTGAALNGAGSAGDPWTTTLPGAYGAGTAGKIVGDNINATVSSRGSQTSVDDLPTNSELATALAASDDAVLAALATVQGDTNDLQARLPSALTGAGNMKADMLALDGSTLSASRLRRSASLIHDGAVTGAATATTLIDSGLTHPDNDQLKGRILIFDGNVTAGLREQATDITGFNATTDTLTFTALTQAPAAGDTYVIV
jgi:hypothetical protein